MGELSGMHNVLGAVSLFAVAPCHGVVLQAFFCESLHDICAIGDDIRGLAYLYCVY